MVGVYYYTVLNGTDNGKSVNLVKLSVDSSQEESTLNKRNNAEYY
jgi:hypothetical protein